MRYGKYVLIGLVVVHNNAFGFENRYSESFMFTRPAYFNIVATQAGWHTYAFNEDRTYALQITPFYQHTFTQGDKTRQYFLMDCKNSLSVVGDTAAGGPTSQSRDIRAEWIGLGSTFSGSFTITPRQMQRGISADFKVGLENLVDNCFFKKFWLGISTEYQEVQNDINFSETTASTQNATIYSTLNQSDWVYGRFTQTQTKSGFGDVRFIVGSRLINCEEWEFGISTYLGVPGHGPVKQWYIFTPQIGFNGHYAWGAQAMIQMPMMGSGDSALNFFLGGDVAYLFKNKQYRSIDLASKPWSRYLILNSTDGRSNLQGINIFTQRVNVSPYCIVDIFAGIRGRWKCVEGTIGYGIYARGDEKITLKCTWPEIYGIAGSAADKSASSSTIAYRAADDATFTVIKEQDLDLKSGEARATMSNNLQAAITIGSESKSASGYFSFGGYIEYAYKNCTLHNWGLWAKAGLSF